MGFGDYGKETGYWCCDWFVFYWASELLFMALVETRIDSRSCLFSSWSSMTTDCRAWGREGIVGGWGRFGRFKSGGGVKPGGNGGGGSKFKRGGIGRVPDGVWYPLFSKFRLYKLGGGGK